MSKKTKSTIFTVIICVIAVILCLLLIKTAVSLISQRCEDGLNELISATTEMTTETEQTEIIETTTKHLNDETTAEKMTAEETTTKATTETSTKETTKGQTSGYVNRDVPKNNTIKTYMDYRAITSINSKQYKLQKSLAYTDSKGLRMVNGRYCVAVGSYYTTTIGQYIDIELENGKVIKGILADCKADKHTDSTNRMHPDGSVVEFVVDTKSLDSTAKRMGDISYVNGWNSRVVNIKVYDKAEKF